MSFHQKRKNKIENEFKAQAARTTCRLRFVHVPPTLPPAYPPTSQAQEGLGCVSMMEPDGSDLQREITRF